MNYLKTFKQSCSAVISVFIMVRNEKQRGKWCLTIRSTDAWEERSEALKTDPALCHLQKCHFNPVEKNNFRISARLASSFIYISKGYHAMFYFNLNLSDQMVILSIWRIEGYLFIDPALWDRSKWWNTWAEQPHGRQLFALLPIMSLKCSDTERCTHWQRAGFAAARVGAESPCAAMHDKDKSERGGMLHLTTRFWQ